MQQKKEKKKKKKCTVYSVTTMDVLQASWGSALHWLQEQLLYQNFCDVVVVRETVYI